MLLRFDVHLSYTPNLLVSPSHFQNSLSMFSIARVNGIPLWDFCPSDFQRALKIIIIAAIFIVMTISPGKVRHTVIKATSHSTIVDTPMRPLREDQKHRHRFSR